MMSDAFKNRRRFPRIHSENAVFVKKLGSESEEGFAKTRSLGPGGCMFVNPEPLGVGSVIEIPIHTRDHVIQAVGRVVYEKENGRSGYEVGLEFGAISLEDQKLLHKLFGAQGTVLSNG
jgi:hypothetical protein